MKMAIASGYMHEPCCFKEDRKKIKFDLVVWTNSNKTNSLEPIPSEQFIDNTVI